MGHVQRQQGLVLLDQRRAATEVHVHVPQPGDQVTAASVDGGAGLPLRACSGVVGYCNDAAVTDRHRLRGHGAAMLDIDHGRVADHDIGLGGRGDGGGDAGCQCRQQQAEGVLHQEVPVVSDCHVGR